MKKWVVTGLVVLALIGLGVTVPRWLPFLLPFLDTQSDRIQALADAVQLLFWAGAAIVALVRIWKVRRTPQGEPEGLAPVKARHGAAAWDGGIAAGRGGAAVGRDVHGGLTVFNVEIGSVERFWEAVGERRPAEDLTRATVRYLEHLVDRYRYLELKGMGVTDRVALRLPLLDLYIPLAARVETPEGETWARDLRLAGRAPAAEEMQAMGERLSEPRPILDLLRSTDGLVVLGDPGAGKSTFLKYLALTTAAGTGGDLEPGPRLPILLPLSAYADAIAEKEMPLVPFIARYYRERGVDLPLDAMLDRALAQGGALLLFDGLDEVRDFRQRLLVVERVRDFFSFHRQAGNKFVLTSRIVGYREVRPQAEGLTECTLVDFDDEEIATFVEKWTQAVERAVRGRPRWRASRRQRKRRSCCRRRAATQGYARSPPTRCC